MSALKNIIRMSGRSSGVTFELRAKNLKVGKCLAGTALYWSWMLYHHIIIDISDETSSILQSSRQRHFNI